MLKFLKTEAVVVIEIEVVAADVMTTNEVVVVKEKVVKDVSIQNKVALETEAKDAVILETEVKDEVLIAKIDQDVQSLALQDRGVQDVNQTLLLIFSQNYTQNGIYSFSLLLL